MTFKEFLEATDRFERTHVGGRPYLGLDLLRRSSKQQEGYETQNLGEQLTAELRTFQSGRLETLGLPRISSIHVFVGSRATLYHCHYDLNPNLHFQLSGRKRFIMFPPSDWPHLYPFPCHHNLDRRSMVNLDTPDGEAFPSWMHAYFLTRYRDSSRL